jgi:hypothetical protein
LLLRACCILSALAAMPLVAALKPVRHSAER